MMNNLLFALLYLTLSGCHEKPSQPTPITDTSPGYSEKHAWKEFYRRNCLESLQEHPEHSQDKEAACSSKDAIECTRKLINCGTVASAIEVCRNPGANQCIDTILYYSSDAGIAIDVCKHRDAAKCVDLVLNHSRDASVAIEVCKNPEGNECMETLMPLTRSEPETFKVCKDTTIFKCVQDKRKLNASTDIHQIIRSCTRWTPSFFERI